MENETSVLLPVETPGFFSPTGQLDAHECPQDPTAQGGEADSRPRRSSPGTAGCSPAGPHSPQINPLRASLSATPLAFLHPKLCRFPAAPATGPPRGPYLETRRAKAASRSPRTRNWGRRRCPRSCLGTRRLCRGPRPAETRGTNGPGALLSARLRSKCYLGRRVSRGARLSRVEPGGPEVPQTRHGTRASSPALSDLTKSPPRSQDGCGKVAAPRRQAREEPGQ